VSSARTPPVHLAHVLSSFGVGGQERVAVDLAARQVAGGYRVTAISLAPPPEGPLAESFREVGAEVVTIPRAWNGLDPALVLRLSRWMKANRVDLVHTHNRMALLYGAPSAWLAGAAAVHSKHGYNPGGGAELVAARVAARCVDAFVAVSSETADVARRRREVDPARLSVVANGIALERFGPDPARGARLREALGATGAFVVGTVGRAAPEKNQALLIRAMAPLLGPTTRLVIAGDGPSLPALRELAIALGVAGFVHLLGNRTDVPDVLRALDVFVLSSTTEGLPLVIPEAMATGLPVVATRVGGVPNVIDDGRTGFLVPSEDVEALRSRLAALRDDPAARRALGATARATALERFSSERMHRDYLAVYERVLARG
jgi:glycosyltransferase involved in cell wall biosynthesis